MCRIPREGSLGYAVVFDRLYLHAGENWRERLEAAIAGADVFLLLRSSHAARSMPVRWEIECAHTRLGGSGGKPALKILPFALESSEGIGSPLGLEHLHVPEPPIAWFSQALKEQVSRQQPVWARWLGGRRANASGSWRRSNDRAFDAGPSEAPYRSRRRRR